MAMNLKDDIKPISYIKTNAADMMKYINDHNTAVRLKFEFFKNQLIC